MVIYLSKKADVPLIASPADLERHPGIFGG
jgi:hypothetical protein